MFGEVAERSGLPRDAVDQMVDALIMPSVLAWRDGISPETTARALQIDGLEDRRAEWEPRLTRLLASTSLRLSVKAVRLVVGDEKVMTNSRVISDLRPVFDPNEEADAGPTPVAGIVRHTLRIDYVENADTKTFVVSLDRLDIDELRKALDRAERKGRSLQQLVTEAGMLHLDVERQES
jgi:hypothetical protein